MDSLMDFDALLQMAKKNTEETKKNSQYYSTKFAPQKKETKENKRLEQNVKKFLERQEQEQREKEEARREQVAKLQAMRSQKAKGRISKMLKTTKSSDKSVIEDDTTRSRKEPPSRIVADNMAQDDYGHVSAEADAYYEKYLEKVKHIDLNNTFKTQRPAKDINGTRERVKAALVRDLENNGNERQRKQQTTTTTTTTTTTAPVQSANVVKSVEKKEEEKEKVSQKKIRKPMPPPMDFHELIKLAEKKQHEPIKLPTKKEPERLMSAKEKKFLDDIKAAREARQRRQMEESGKREKGDVEPATTNGTNNSKTAGRLPTQNKSTSISSGTSKAVAKGTMSISSNNTSKTTTTTSTTTTLSKNPNSGKGQSTGRTVISSMSRSNGNQPATVNSQTSTSGKKSISSVNNYNHNSNNIKSNNSTNLYSAKKSVNGQQRPQLPQKLSSSTSSNCKSKTDIIRKESQHNLKNYFNSMADKKKEMLSKRRYDDYDEDSELDEDSDMDDFIDDSDEDQDYSSHIKAIFGYDKSKYRHIDEEDDRNMESSFAQVQREEYISKKLGIQEDLEDMEMEAREKKRKQMLKKRRLMK